MDLKAQVMRRANKLDQAVEAYESMIDRARRDPNLNDKQRDLVIDESRYSLSSVYVDLNQIDKAADQLKALLDKDPDNPTFNNDLGFIWADKGMNLAESEKMIRKAIESDRKQRLKDNPELKEADIKDNPSYLDSLGWVLFKQKKYKQARPYLQAAVDQEDGQNSEIYDHLGDCLLALGEKTKAIASWKKAIETSTATRRDQKRKVEIEKKLKEAMEE
jgi:tetratricopeptide (TPR) repeat protein